MPSPFRVSVNGVMRLWALFAVVAIASLGKAICAQETNASTAADRFIMLQETDASLSNDPILGRTRVRVDSLQHTLELDTSRAPYSVVLGQNDPLNIPVEAIIRLRFLTQDLARASFLTPSVNDALDHVRIQIVDCAHHELLATSTLEHAAKSPQCAAIETGFTQLSEVITDQARARDLTVVHSKGVSAGYRVDFKFTPRPYPLKIMTALEHRKCQILHDSEAQYFNRVFSDHETMLGRYYYQLDWPKELGGTETGFILIDAAKTLTFVSNGN